MDYNRIFRLAETDSRNVVSSQGISGNRTEILKNLLTAVLSAKPVEELGFDHVVRHLRRFIRVETGRDPIEFHDAVSAQAFDPSGLRYLDTVALVTLLTALVPQAADKTSVKIVWEDGDDQSVLASDAPTLASEREGDFVSILRYYWRDLCDYISKIDDRLLDHYAGFNVLASDLVTLAGPRSAGYTVVEKRFRSSAIKSAVNELIQAHENDAAREISDLVRYRGNCVDNRVMQPLPSDGRRIPVDSASHPLALYPISVRESISVYRHVLSAFLAAKALTLGRISRTALSVEMCRYASVLFPAAVINKIVRNRFWFTWQGREGLSKAHFFNVRGYVVTADTWTTLDAARKNLFLGTISEILRKTSCTAKEDSSLAQGGIRLLLKMVNDPSYALVTRSLLSGYLSPSEVDSTNNQLPRERKLLVFC